MDSIDPQPPVEIDATRQVPRRRWFQFHLRTLLLVVGLCAVAAFLWRMLADVQRPEKYEAPSIVFVGSAIQLTSGMGGDSKDMDSYTIPVRPKKPTGEATTA